MSPLKVILTWFLYLITFSAIYAAYSSLVSGEWLLEFSRNFYGNLEYGPVFGRIYNTLRTTTCLALNGAVILAFHRSENFAKKYNLDQAGIKKIKEISISTPRAVLALWTSCYFLFFAISESLSAFMPYSWKIWLVSSFNGEEIVELGCEHDGELELIVVTLVLSSILIYVVSFVWSRWRNR